MIITVFPCLKLHVIIGAPEYQFRDRNHIALFNHSKEKINLKLLEISQIVQSVLNAPLLATSHDWIELKKFYHCSAIVEPNLYQIATIANYVKINKSNWLAPKNPVSIQDSWTSQDQVNFDAIITAKSAEESSFNVSALRESYMREKFEKILGSVYDQREDAFVNLGRIDSMLLDLKTSLSHFLLLISVCHGNSLFGAQLAHSSCPGLLLSTQLPLYQIETLTCLANSKKLTVSYKIHQESQLFSDGIFQRAVLVSSSLSLAVQLAVYTYMLFRLIKNYKRKKEAMARAALRRAHKKSETRPFIPTGQVAVNSAVYVPPKK